MSESDRPSTSISDSTQPDARPAQAGGNERFDRNSGSGVNSGGNRHGGRRRGGGGGQQGLGEPRRAEGTAQSSVNMAELRELVELISTHGFTDFELEREGFRVRLRREQSGTIAPVAASVNTPIATSFTGAAPAVASSPISAPGITAPDAALSSSVSTESVVSSAAISLEASSDADLQTITSPIVGTFYRSASPTSEPFVKVGSSVGADSVVCIVEAMKLMNEILAETSGTIEKIYVENAQPVEYGQALFGVRK